MARPLSDDPKVRVTVFIRRSVFDRIQAKNGHVPTVLAGMADGLAAYEGDLHVNPAGTPIEGPAAMRPDASARRAHAPTCACPICKP